MIKSEITGKVYEPSMAVYISNMLQCQKMLKHIGSQDLLDIIVSDRGKDALVFVWERNERTKACKVLWDQHAL
jgi:hypothetical protein